MAVLVKENYEGYISQEVLLRQGKVSPGGTAASAPP
jgi:hypothetical protein